jgi:hypothetical protein
VAPIRVARHTLGGLPQRQARRCRWNPSPAQFGNASRRQRITAGTKSQRNRGPGTSRWHRPLSSEGTSEHRQYPWLAEQPVMHGRRCSVLASESQAYRRQCARSPWPSISLSVTADRAGTRRAAAPSYTRLPVPHRLTPPRRSAGPAACRRQGPLDDPRWRSSPDPGPPTVSKHPPSRRPFLEPRWHLGIPAGAPAHALRRDPRPASPSRVTGPVRRARRTRTPGHGIQGDPVRGKSGCLPQAG